MRFEIVPGVVPVDMLDLAHANGWEGTEARVARNLALQPDGSFSARGPEGETLGVVSCVLWGDVAWIGSMLVAEEARRHGVGRALLDAAMSFADARGAATIALDATPMGRLLYERAGFEPAWGQSARWTKDAASGGTRGDGAAGAGGGEGERGKGVAIYPVSPAEIMELVACDTPRFGAPRGRFLAALMAARPHHAFVAVDRQTGVFRGHVLAYDDRIGPLVADTPDAATRLLAAIERAGISREAIVPAWNPEAERVFAAAGYQKGPACLRMIRGAPLRGRPDAIYGIGAWASG